MATKLRGRQLDDNGVDVIDVNQQVASKVTDSVDDNGVDAVDTNGNKPRGDGSIDDNGVDAVDVNGNKLRGDGSVDDSLLPPPTPALEWRAPGTGAASQEEVPEATFISSGAIRPRHLRSRDRADRQAPACGSGCAAAILANQRVWSRRTMALSTAVAACTRDTAQLADPRVDGAPGQIRHPSHSPSAKAAVVEDLRTYLADSG